MPRRPLKTAARRRAGVPTSAGRNRRPIGLAVGGIVALGLVSAWLLSRPTPRERAVRAESEARKAGSGADPRWIEALGAWKEINASKDADTRSYLGEARSALALNRAAEAERALKKAAGADPGEPEPILRLLDLYRLEDRPIDAIEVGQGAIRAVRRAGRRDVVRALTLALLADAPDRVARAALKRFAEADPDDLDARLALLRRVEPEGARPGGSGGRERTEKLQAMFEKAPDHIGIREALAIARIDEGRWDRAGEILDRWPESGRDARYWRLRGRRELDREHRADRALEAFEKALSGLPHDPGTRANLARALHATGRDVEARRQAEAVDRLRETLDPARLGPRLDADLGKLDDPAARSDLADLCRSVGLSSLADAWTAIYRTDEPESSWVR